MPNNTLLHLSKKSNKDEELKPLFFDLSNRKNLNMLGRLIDDKKIFYISDDYEEQIRELYAINNPTSVYGPMFGEQLNNYILNLKKRVPLLKQGVWVYFPWNGGLVHILKEPDFYKVRTARNRYLINEQEQSKFYNSVIGIGGLSVGNSVILSVVLQGGGRHIRIADFDRLALSNTNRIRGSIASLGMRKAEMTARQIYEINPYAKIEIFSMGITPKNINKFFASTPKLDVVIDELDNIAVKFLIRQYAKKYKVPVVMGADDGDNAVVDIERYDLKPQPKFFHGRLGNTSYEQLKNLDKFGIGKTITQHIGPENITERMQQSLLAMGKTIVSWPQLGGAALLNGSAVAYCVRKILNGQPLEKNRAIISLDEKLIPNYNSKKEKNKRTRIAKNFKKMFGL
jgi:tRNA threonylcarbamoyladenosine dehydratase